MSIKVHIYAIPLLASVLVAVLLWGRNNDLDVYENPLGYQEEGDDRVLHRTKRGNFAARLNTIYQRLSDNEDCCKDPLPDILPQDAMDACQNGNYVPQKQKQKQKTKQKDNWLSRIRKNFLPSTAKKATTNNKNQAARKGRQAASTEPQKILLSSVCYTDCVFSYLGLLNESALILQKIEDTFKATNTDPKWENTILDALYACEEPSACASPETILVNKKYWCMKPTILMNCMRIQLSKACARKNTAKCNTALAQLKRTDVFKAHRD
ncbi:uncharacterized protein LOC132197599 [Neocloeon triangulifer]|uniref:uncharacterized protein LOC132197599 n=1 Tax=Neocloeon triangulifer TaxID=2078957 RepID=UPI00286F8C2A|nr:uncharacterized protein LOC132197599 [Neocloeon triangulifer]